MYVLVKQVDSAEGVIYTRWGRTECSSGNTELYQGFVGGTWYSDGGGLGSLLCLPDTPSYVQTSSVSTYTHIYSAEYETQNKVFDVDTNNYDIPCVVCLAPSHSTSVMIPGTPSCPNSLILEYSGYLMSSRESHAVDAICVDDNPEKLLSSDQNTDGALVYFVVADCNASFMPCDPYKHQVPLSCAVCSY